MSTTEHALSLIFEERQSQINDHGFSNEHALNHPEFYEEGEHLDAAIFCLMELNAFWPKHWDEHYRDKVAAKGPINKLIVAAALIVAEIERLETIKFNIITDVEPINVDGLDNWNEWKAAFIKCAVADEFKIEAIETIDFELARQVYFENGISAIEAYKDFFYE